MSLGRDVNTFLTATRGTQSSKTTVLAILRYSRVRKQPSEGLFQQNGSDL